MKYIYTATFVPNEDGTKFYCRVPDLPGCITTGDSIEDAIEMITDAASGPAPLSVLTHYPIVQQLIPEQSAKMFHFPHGWRH